MKIDLQVPRDLAVLGRGEAFRGDGEPYRRKLVSTVRYADPAAWTTVAAAARAAALHEAELAAAADHVAVISVGRWGPADTIAAIRSAVASGMVSPLRFPAASPGSLAGLTCIALGFHGSTLNFTMPPEAGVSLALHVAECWLERETARFVLLAASDVCGDNEPAVRCLLLAGRESDAASANTFQPADAQWLSQFEAPRRPPEERA